jgi:tetrapyrrole methylase family protein/MazG family protein
MSKLYDLVNIMRQLRAPDGCPWDREQTHKSLVPYLLEETYEVIETIETGEMDRLKEELGDLLLQIVFHAQLASEVGRFDIDDISTSICDKLVRRHPHVFERKTEITPEQVTVNWEHIKLTRDKSENGAPKTVLAGVPKNLPALLRAYRVQEKAARFGFDWEKVDDIVRKLDEEVAELKSELRRSDRTAIEEELGDLLFTAVNIARFLKIEPEGALNRITNKFMRRFGYIEQRLAESDRTVADATLAEMDSLWEESKTALK